MSEKHRRKTRKLTPAQQYEAAGGAAPFPDPVVLPITGVLDLHSFSPRELAPLLDDYLEACLARGLTQIKIIHGKGTGQLKARVRQLLARHPLVLDLRDAEVSGGGWGATTVTLRAPE